jgi:translation elongation factor EF-4
MNKIHEQIRKDFHQIRSELKPNQQCETIRTVVHLNHEEATLNDFIEALAGIVKEPTIRKQYYESMKIVRELDALD